MDDRELIRCDVEGDLAAQPVRQVTRVKTTSSVDVNSVEELLAVEAVIDAGFLCGVLGTNIFVT